jgi:hypothetical protein
MSISQDITQPFLLQFSYKLVWKPNNYHKALTLVFPHIIITEYSVCKSFSNTLNMMTTVAFFPQY